MRMSLRAGRVRRRAVLLGAAGGVGALTLPPAARGSGAGVDTVLEWYDVTAKAIGVITGPRQVTSSRAWAIGWIAAWRATAGRHGPGAEAALAGAVHDTLRVLLPDAAATVDAALVTTLDRLGSSAQVRGALAAGQRAARAVLAERDGDGLGFDAVNRPFATPPAAPGIWQPTPPAYSTAVQAGQGNGRPFLLADVHPFQPEPPPALDSGTYLRDLAESRAVGAVDSTVRTSAQTDVARFWAQTSLNGFTPVLRSVLAPGGAYHAGRQPIQRRIELVALFHAVTTDAQVTTYAAKYRYLRWRPATAIQTGTIDPDPGWTPLIATPAHPEYPSGHTTYAGAAQVVLSTVAGPPAGSITVGSPAAPDVTLTYRGWSELVWDNIDARVWSGIHFRHSDEVGIATGRRVARAALTRWNGQPR